MLWLWLWLMLLNQLKLLRDLKLRLKVGVGNIYLALKWNWFQSFVGVRLKIGRKQETLGSKGSLYYLAPAPIVGRSLRSTTYPLKSKMTTSKHVRFQRHLLQSAIPHIRQHGFTVASILASSQVDEKLVRSHFPGPPSSKPLQKGVYSELGMFISSIDDLQSSRKERIALKRERTKFSLPRNGLSPSGKTLGELESPRTSIECESRSVIWAAYQRRLTLCFFFLNRPWL